MANTVTVQVLADVKNMVNGINTTNTHLGGLTDKVGKVTSAVKGMVAGFAGLAAINLLGDTISAASDLQETVSKSDTVFGENAAAMRAWANNAATAFGMSRQEALAGASQFGNFFDQIGIGGQQAVEMSQGFVQMATDLGSFNNAAPVDVMNALQAATRGEYDALQAFVPTINAAAVQAEAFAQTGKSSADSLTEADKAAALYTLTTKGMGAAQGDFAKTSDGLANQQRILQAKFEDVKATIGGALLPVLSSLAAWVLDTGIPAFQQFASWFGDHIVPKLQELWTTIQTNVLPVLQQLGDFFIGTIVPALQSAAGFIQENSTLFGALGVALTTLYAAFVIYNTAMSTWTALTKGYAAMQLFFNGIMMINPFILILAGLVALVAALVYAWNHSETFRNVVIGVWEAIKGAVSSVLGWFTGTLWPGILGVYESIKNGMSTVKQWFIDRWNDVTGFVAGVPGRILGFFSGIAGWFAGVWTGIKDGAVTGFNNVVTFIGGIPGRIMSALGSLGSLLTGAGRSVIDGFLGGITGAFDKVKSTLKNLTGMLPDWKGPADVDKTILIKSGQLVIGGLIKGLESQYKYVNRSLGGLTSNIAGTQFRSPQLAFASGGNTSAPAAPPIIINAGLGTDPVELERAVVSALKGYSNKNGSGWMNRL